MHLFSKVSSPWQQCESFQWRCRNKPPLFSHLYFISIAWVPSEPTLRLRASISISIACLFIAKLFHHDMLPFFMQISNWLLVKICSAIIVHQKSFIELLRWNYCHMEKNRHRLNSSTDETTLCCCDCAETLTEWGDLMTPGGRHAQQMKTH